PNYIAIPQPQQVVSDPAFAGRVTRDPGTGLITLVDDSYVNAEKYKTSGWDVTTDYHEQTAAGTFALHVLATVVAHDDRQYTIGSPLISYVGYPNEGGETKTKATATVSWQLGGWSLGWTTTYYASYRQICAPGSPLNLQSPGLCSTLPAQFAYFRGQGGYSIPGQTYHDISGGY